MRDGSEVFESRLINRRPSSCNAVAGHRIHPLMVGGVATTVHLQEETSWSPFRRRDSIRSSKSLRESRSDSTLRLADKSIPTMYWLVGAGGGFAPADRSHPRTTRQASVTAARPIRSELRNHKELASLRLIGIRGATAAKSRRRISNSSFRRAKSAGSGKPRSASTVGSDSGGGLEKARTFAGSMPRRPGVFASEERNDAAESISFRAPLCQWTSCHQMFRAADSLSRKRFSVSPCL